jgi:predicted transcriptional regulator
MSLEGISLKDWRFNQDVSRKELARMISLHGFPLSIVDYDGFRRFVSSLNPVFKMVSRRTIIDDCSKKYLEERQVLLDVFKNVKGRVLLTMDMWTSNQTLGYMCITCHFTDDD